MPRASLLERPDDCNVVNWDNPIANGLSYLWPLHESTGYREIITGQWPTLTNPTVFEWRPDPDLGKSLIQPGGSNAVMMATGLTTLAAPWTFCVMVRKIATSASAGYLTGNSSDYGGVLLEQFSTKQIGFTSGFNFYSYGVSAPTDRTVMLVFVALGSTQTLYINGIAQSSTITPSATALQLSQLGNNTNFSVSPARGWFGHMGVWRRALSPGEIVALSNPETRWDLYQQIPRRAYAFISSGTPATVVAVAAWGGGQSVPSVLTAGANVSAMHARGGGVCVPSVINGGATIAGAVSWGGGVASPGSVPSGGVNVTQAPCWGGGVSNPSSIVAGATVTAVGAWGGGRLDQLAASAAAVVNVSVPYAPPGAGWAGAPALSAGAVVSALAPWGGGRMCEGAIAGAAVLVSVPSSTWAGGRCTPSALAAGATLPVVASWGGGTAGAPSLQAAATVTAVGSRAGGWAGPATLTAGAVVAPPGARGGGWVSVPAPAGSGSAALVAAVGTFARGWAASRAFAWQPRIAAVVPREDRVAVVKFENRVVVVPADPRVADVPREPEE